MNKYLTKEMFTEIINLTGRQQEKILVNIYGVLEVLEEIAQEREIKSVEVFERVGTKVRVVVDFYKAQNEQKKVSEDNDNDVDSEEL